MVAALITALLAPPQGPIPVAFVLTEGATMIDFAGPWEVFQDVHGPVQVVERRSNGRGALVPVRYSDRREARQVCRRAVEPVDVRLNVLDVQVGLARASEPSNSRFPRSPRCPRATYRATCRCRDRTCG